MSTAPKRLSDEWVQWTRRMVYHTLPKMRRLFPATLTEWRGRQNHRILVGFLNEANFSDIPAGVCHFGADIGKPGEPKVVKHAFQLHRYLVTNEMYELFDPAHKTNRWYNPLYKGPHRLARDNPGGDDKCPVVHITWYDAYCFAAWCGCRLPTELQWEHACRGVPQPGDPPGAFRFSYGNDEAELPDHAWFTENSQDMTHPVGKKPIADKAHPHGLFDMHGNVWELCDNFYDSEQADRVLRGGSWKLNAKSCRAAARTECEPWWGNDDIGFRLCRPGPDFQE